MPMTMRRKHWQKQKKERNIFMTKPGDSQTKKTIHELVKEFPDKSYRELEIYRDADRQKEAASIPLTESQKSQDKLEPIGVGHNHPPDEAQQIPLSESQQKQEELEPIADEVGACITAGMKRDKEATELQVMKRRAQEAEGELSILKGIETNRVKEAQARSNQLQDELDKLKKDNNDLYNRIADALEVNESHQKVNGKLQERLTELEEENKKMHDALNKRMNNIRKSGM